MKSSKFRQLIVCTTIALIASLNMHTTITIASAPNPGTNEIIFYYNSTGSPGTPSEPEDPPVVSSTAEPTTQPSTTTSEATTVTTSEASSETSSEASSEASSETSSEVTTETEEVPTTENPDGTDPDDTDPDDIIPPVVTIPDDVTSESENAVTVEEDGTSYTLVPDENLDIIYVFDDMGTPLGYINYSEDIDLFDLEIMDNLIPFGSIEIDETVLLDAIKDNPKTSGEHTTFIYRVVALACLVGVLFILRDKDTMNERR